MTDPMRFCSIVPVYRHGEPLLKVVAAIAARDLPVFIVDDGNDGATKGFIDRAARENPGAAVVTLAQNGGKGAAVMAGMKAALEAGYTHAIQIDADGQHDLDAIERFLALSRENPRALVSGYPEYDESVPAARKAGRKFTNAWVAIETLSTDVTDAMCGFRVYPLAPAVKVIRRSWIGRRMTFDIEIIVRLMWAGIPVRFDGVKVIYPEGGVSNFRMVKDNVAITGMHTKLFFGMIPRIPLILGRRALRR